ncbi:hypothetical protein OKW18_003606 [Streptomyces pratensis]|nr:hypothetical protein [Streptomyces pratensis]
MEDIAADVRGRGGLTVANLPEGLRAAIGGPAHGL